jgi:hypothetical protein
MRRIALALAAVLGSGCIWVDHTNDNSCSTPGTLSVFWTFQRDTTAGAKYYGCTQAGVDFIRVYLNGVRAYPPPEDGDAAYGDCAGLPTGSEGIGFDQVYDASYALDVYGYDSADELTFAYSGTAYAETCNDILLVADREDLVVSADSATAATCSSTGIDHFDFDLYDVAGNLISTGTKPCYTQSFGGTPSSLPSMDAGFEDLGYLSLDIRAEDVNGANLGSACYANFEHVYVDGAGTGADFVSVALPSGTSCF